jgi:hypothetical protein
MTRIVRLLDPKTVIYKNPGSGSCSYRCPDLLRLYAFAFGITLVTGLIPFQSLRLDE